MALARIYIKSEVLILKVLRLISLGFAVFAISFVFADYHYRTTVEHEIFAT